MANQRFRSFNRGRSGPRRQTEWLSLTASGLTTLAVASKARFAQLVTLEIAKLPFTITRTIGLLYVESDQAAATESASGAMGMTVVSERANTVGITALPDPVTESEADFWFVYEPWQIAFRFSGNGSSDYVYTKVFDSRAQRKVEEGDQIVGVIANVSAGSAVNFGIQFRMLIKLH